MLDDASGHSPPDDPAALQVTDVRIIKDSQTRRSKVMPCPTESALSVPLIVERGRASPTWSSSASRTARPPS